MPLFEFTLIGKVDLNSEVKSGTVETASGPKGWVSASILFKTMSREGEVYHKRIFFFDEDEKEILEKSRKENVFVSFKVKYVYGRLYQSKMIYMRDKSLQFADDITEENTNVNLTKFNAYPMNIERYEKNHFTKFTLVDRQDPKKRVHAILWDDSGLEVNATEWADWGLLPFNIYAYVRETGEKRIFINDIKNISHFNLCPCFIVLSKDYDTALNLLPKNNN